MTAPTQAEIDAAVMLARALKAEIAKLPKSDERREIIETTLMVPVESSEVICDALLALAAEREWRPIESAPKDYMLIVAGKTGTGTGYWKKQCGPDEGYWSDEYGHPIDEPVTHWLPLPKPPTPAGEGG